ncbi:hypothetical protein HK101_002342 [Irineochytrium annulatum]|nr:hypothetical protein HK101_002342 [Irineochytrium annulatum]
MRRLPVQRILLVLILLSTLCFWMVTFPSGRGDHSINSSPGRPLSAALNALLLKDDESDSSNRGLFPDGFERPDPEKLAAEERLKAVLAASVQRNKDYIDHLLNLFPSAVGDTSNAWWADPRPRRYLEIASMDRHNASLKCGPVSDGEAARSPKLVHVCPSSLSRNLTAYDLDTFVRDREDYHLPGEFLDVFRTVLDRTRSRFGKEFVNDSRMVFGDVKADGDGDVKVRPTWAELMRIFYHARDVFSSRERNKEAEREAARARQRKYRRDEADYEEMTWDSPLDDEEALVHAREDNVAPEHVRKAPRPLLAHLNVTKISGGTGLLQRGASTIECVTLNPKISQTVCDTRNVAIDASMVPPRERARMNPLTGAVKASCGVHPNVTDGGVGNFTSFDMAWWFRLPEKISDDGGSGWFQHGLDLVDPHNNDNITCTARVHTTLFVVRRWDTTNPYQAHQDFLTAFQAYAALGLDPSTTSVVLLDPRNPDGPYTAAWSGIFSHPTRDTPDPLIDLRALMASLSYQGGAGRVCFDRVVWAPHGGLSPLAIDGNQRRHCELNPLLLGFRSFMLDGWRRVGLRKHRAKVPMLDAGLVDVKTGRHDPTLVSMPLPPSVASLEGEIGWEASTAVKNAVERRAGPHRLRNGVTFVSGRWPSGASYDVEVAPIRVTYAIRKTATPASSASVKVDEEWAGPMTVEYDAYGGVRNVNPSPGPLKRVLTNEAYFIKKIEKAVGEFGVEEEGEAARRVKVTFRAVDMASLSFEEQVAVAQATDVWVGPQ